MSQSESPNRPAAVSNGGSQSVDRPSGAGDPRTLSRDDAYHLLQNSRRRAVLRYLFAAEEERVRMRDVAEAIAAWEHDTTVQRLRSGERQRVYIALYQSHLPKLDEHGIIDYEQSRGWITLKPLASVLEPLVDDGLAADESLTVSDEPEQRDGLLGWIRGR